MRVHFSWFLSTLTYNRRIKLEMPFRNHRFDQRMCRQLIRLCNKYNGKNAIQILIQIVCAKRMRNVFEGRVWARQNEEFIRIETRKCMLRPNSFPLFCIFYQLFSTWITQIKGSIILCFVFRHRNASCCLAHCRWLSAILVHTHVYVVIIIYRKCYRVTFFPIEKTKSSKKKSPPRSNWFYFDFGTSL